MPAGQGDTSSKHRRVRVRVRGRVQGVGYRASTRYQAQRLGLAGWVRNLDDGEVELEAQGEDEQVAALVAWCAQGPSLAKVASVQVEEVELVAGEGGGFEIRR